MIFGLYRSEFGVVIELTMRTIQICKTNACHTNDKSDGSLAITKRFRVIVADYNSIAKAMTIWGYNECRTQI